MYMYVDAWKSNLVTMVLVLSFIENCVIDYETRLRNVLVDSQSRL